MLRREEGSEDRVRVGARGTGKPGEWPVEAGGVACDSTPIPAHEVCTEGEDVLLEVERISPQRREAHPAVLLSTGDFCTFR